MALQTIIKGNPSGVVTLETFAAKLLDKVIQAPSEAAIERYIAVAFRALSNKKINGYVIQRFIDRVTRYLDSHTPLNEQQSANSRIARQHLQAFRQELAVPVNKS